jgi:hypothetical protein
MQTQPQPDAEVAHFQASYDDLNVRIGRLAIALRVPLESDADAENALKTLADMAVAVERRAVAERRSASRTEGGTERRLGYQRAELRGLLVMRYDMEAKLYEQLGFTVARQIIESSAQTLTRHGFYT